MSTLSENEIERYARQIILKEIGGAGQQALKAAKVLIIGGGGLGGPAGLYLAAAGIGTIGITDYDTVELSNLHRQIQFTNDDLGAMKTEAMAKRLRAINPHIRVKAHNGKLDNDTAAPLINHYDLVLDGTDDFETRFAVNAACIATRTPLLSGALGRFDGQIALFENTGSGPCYRCLVSDIPPDAQTCAEVGIVGALAGVIGSMMALEAVKWITGAGDTLAGRLFIYDGLTAKARTLTLPRDPLCKACS